MKILQLPSYVTIKELKSFSRRKSGYGFMTWEIAKSISKKEIQIDLLTKYNITEGLMYEGVNILENSWLKILLNCKPRHFLNAVKILRRNEILGKKIPYILFFHVSMGYLEKLLKKNAYDIVHIHGIGDFSKPILEICRKKDIMCVITLHGLNSFGAATNISEREEKIEKDFLKFAENNELPVTVVSSGVRKKILEYLKIEYSKNFTVIPNGCDIKPGKQSSSDLNIRELHEINKEKKIIVSVGRIDENKNQTQIIKAFSQICNEIQTNLVILFIGGDGSNGAFQEALKNSEYSSHLIYCGFVQKENLNAYYQQSDANIVVSKEEGFGLPIIEGFVHGLPCLTYADLDAVPDLYNKEAMLLMQGRSNDELARGMEQIIKSRWEKEFIKEYSRKFSLEKMAEDYIELYNKCSRVISSKE